MGHDSLATTQRAPRQATARQPASVVERWDTSFGAGKGGREGGYADYYSTGDGGLVPRSDNDPNRMGHKKRSQLDSMDLQHFRRTQLAKTLTGQTYDDSGEEEEPSSGNLVEPDMVMPRAALW